MEQVKDTGNIGTDFFSSLLSKTWIWKIGILLLMLPFAVLAFYNHPAADDFCYVHMVELKGLWQTQWHWYTQWSGRYTATFLQTFNPLAWKSTLGYQLESILILGLLIFAVYRLIKEWIILGSAYSTWLLTFGILVLYLLQMPSLIQGLYWLSGALTYQAGNIATLLGLAYLYRLYWNKHNRWQEVLLISLLAIVACGANETSLLEWMFLLTVGIVFRVFTERKLPISWVMIGMVSIVASSIVLMAPGNSIRASYFPQHHDVWLSLKISIWGTLSLLGQWTPSLILAGCVLLPFVRSNTIILRPKVTKQGVGLYGLLLPAVVFVGVFPACWSMGSMPPARTLNVVYLLFLLSSLYVVLSLRSSLEWKALPLYARLLCLFLLVTFLLPANNYRTACMDLISGRAAAYNREMNQRYDKLEEGQQTVRLEPLTVRPVSLFLSDMEENSDDWKNTCAADYFHVDSIIVKRAHE